MDAPPRSRGRRVDLGESDLDSASAPLSRIDAEDAAPARASTGIRLGEIRHETVRREEIRSIATAGESG